MPSYRVTQGADAKRLTVQVKNLTGDFKRGIRLGFWETGKNLVKTASNEIKRKKTGRVYKYKGRRIRAGKAGDYHANRSGANRRSLDFEVKGSSELEFGANMPYSSILETGTWDGDKINTKRWRPFIKPTVDKNINKLRANLRREIGRAFRGLR